MLRAVCLFEVMIALSGKFTKFLRREMRKQKKFHVWFHQPQTIVLNQVACQGKRG